MKRKTIAELRAQVDYLMPYQYLVFAIQKGEKPQTFVSANEDTRDGSYGFKVEVYAVAASHGGLVVIDSSVMFLEPWCNEHRRSQDVYIRDVAERVWRYHVQAINDYYQRKEVGS